MGTGTQLRPPCPVTPDPSDFSLSTAPELLRTAGRPPGCSAGKLSMVSGCLARDPSSAPVRGRDFENCLTDVAQLAEERLSFPKGGVPAARAGTTSWCHGVWDEVGIPWSGAAGLGCSVHSTHHSSLVPKTAPAEGAWLLSHTGRSAGPL